MPSRRESLTAAARARVVPRGLADRAVGTFFRAATRMGGLRPALVPAFMRRQLAVIGISDAELGRVLRDIRSLADWPYAWEAEADRHSAAGDHFGAAAAYYTAQRILLTDSPLKRRLYRLCLVEYEQIDQPRLERLRIAASTGDTIAGYLQLPERRAADGKVPLVLIVPGVTATKEEGHPFVLPLLRRGYAVARIDNPGYGETTGKVTAATGQYPTEVLEFLARDPRIDADNMHLLGLSLGAHWTLHSAVSGAARSVVVIAPPYMPDRYFRDLPTMNHTALAHMTGISDFAQLTAFCEQLSLRDIAPRITVPVKIFHGGRDRTIPVSEAYDLAAAVGGPCSVTVWPRDHHICLEHLDDMVAEVLEWLGDPAPAIRRWERELVERAVADAAQDLAREHAPAVDAAPRPGLA